MPDRVGALARAASCSYVLWMSPHVQTQTRTQTQLILAPMAAITHSAFRTLVHEFGGCDLYFSEMISAEAFLGGTPFEYAYRDPRPVPERLVYQLVGKSQEAIVEAARILAREPVLGIDVNMGCSAPQIARKGGGVSWMDHPEAAATLISKLREAVPTKTVSAKFRLGAGKDPDQLRAFGRSLERAGANFLTLHPRLRKQSYSRPSDWKYVNVLREAVSLSVYASGDVTDGPTFERRAAESGVDGIMIGRAAVARPWIVSEIGHNSEPAAGPVRRTAHGGRGPGGEDGPGGGGGGRHGNRGGPGRGGGSGREGDPGRGGEYIDLWAVAHRFNELLEAMQPEPFHKTRARRFYTYFLKNLAFGYRLAAQLQHLESYEEIIHHVASYFEEHPEHRYMNAAGSLLDGTVSGGA